MINERKTEINGKTIEVGKTYKMSIRRGLSSRERVEIEVNKVRAIYQESVAFFFKIRPLATAYKWDILKVEEVTHNAEELIFDDVV